MDFLEVMGQSKAAAAVILKLLDMGATDADPDGEQLRRNLHAAAAELSGAWAEVARMAV